MARQLIRVALVSTVGTAGAAIFGIHLVAAALIGAALGSSAGLIENQS